MTLNPGSRTLGPQDGSLQVRTYREGVAQQVGHDLILDVPGWQATVEIGADGSPSSITLEADSRSLRVKEGLRGVKPLSDKDRRDIVGNIEKKSLLGRPITFRSSEVRQDGDRLRVQGQLTLVGNARPVDAELAIDDAGRLSGTIPIVQSQWGIKPYRGLMGALKVRDSVEVTLDVALGD